MKNLNFTSLYIDKGIAYVGLKHAPGNELNEEYIKELINIFRSILPGTAKNSQALIIHSEVKDIFSNGMNGQLLLDHKVPERVELFKLLLQLIHILYTYPDPVIALIDGHAMAGGAIIAATADYRLFAEGRYRFSFSEARVGLTIPTPLIQMIREFVFPKEISNALLMARAYRPNEALHAGIANSIHDSEHLMNAGKNLAQKIIRHPGASLRSIKHSMRKKTAGEMMEFLENPENELNEFLSSSDFEEGLLASIEKRRPNFSDKSG